MKVQYTDKLRLNKVNIEKYNPPPNPAKIKDPRAKEYIEKFGNTSWEVDALNPQVLHSIIKLNVERLIDINKFNAKFKQEEKDKKELQKMVR